MADGRALLETAQRLTKGIIFTAGADPNAGQEFLETGASAFLRKWSAVLLSIIKRLCGSGGVAP